MPTTQKPQQKQTKATLKPVTKAMEGGKGKVAVVKSKATQKVGGSAKKPVMKAIEGGNGKVAAVKSKATTRCGSGSKVMRKSTTKPQKNIRGGGNSSICTVTCDPQPGAPPDTPIPQNPTRDQS